MDPVFPLYLLGGIAAAAALGWRATRGLRTRPHGRTSWTLLLGFCPRREYSCPMVLDFRAGKDACSKCGNQLRQMVPMSQYQVDGGGTGLKLDPDGPLVASLCHGAWDPSKDYERLPEGARHAPLFDLDYPAMIAADARGTTLVLKKTVSVRAYRTVLARLQETGLARPTDVPHSQAEAPSAGIEGYRMPAGELLSEAVFRLRCPAVLVPSSTDGHFHLYLETEIGWDAYVRLLRAMAEAGLLETGWVELSERRKMAMLRKPGVRKSPA